MITKFQLYDLKEGRSYLHFTLPNGYKTVDDVKIGDLVKVGGKKFRINNYGFDNTKIKRGIKIVTLYVVTDKSDLKG